MMLKKISVRESMVLALATMHEMEGKQVCANLPGWKKPVAISLPLQSGHVPSVVADGKIYDVVPGNSIPNDLSDARWTYFATYAQQNGLKFIIVTLNDCVCLVKERLFQLRLPGVVIALQLLQYT